jgi:hypothetical protein
MDCPHSGTVIHYSECMEPEDGAMSVLFSYQQVQCIQKGSRLQAAEIENVAV